jgi:hypothetical protein
VRTGGRVVIIEAGERGGIRGLLGGGTRAAGDGTATVAALTAAGFRGSRVLAEREGYRFIEGIKG